MNYVTICKYIIEPSQAEMTDYVIIAHPDRQYIMLQICANQCSEAWSRSIENMKMNKPDLAFDNVKPKDWYFVLD